MRKLIKTLHQLFPKRCFSTAFRSNGYQLEMRKKDVRVRFAPSPTGQLHLGSIRTALYNYLFAKSHGGKYILRIEDTDQSRTIEGAMKQLEEDLKWVGLEPDEGPSIGGSYGPYIQSKRLGSYKETAEELVERKAAYLCFCKESRLELLRKDALRRRQIPRYDNRCRNLDPKDAMKRASEGEKFCIRFKIDGMENLTFNDIVYGPITYGGEEGDPIIMKADGFPTYHLANIVDDHSMNITHVLRGVEWQVSTPKHLFLYKALGWEPPEYGHLPLILNADGSKLSKRQGDIQIAYYREKGIFPLALLNYVIDAGGGFNNRNRNHIMGMEELASRFDIKRVGTNSCRLQSDRLKEFNRLELMRLMNGEISSREMVRLLQDTVKKAFHGHEEKYHVDLEDNHVLRILKWGINRIHCIQDLVSPSLEFLWLTPSKSHPSINKDLMMDLSAKLLEVPDDQFNKESLKSILRDFAEKQGLSFGQCMKIIRQEISGLKDGPGVAEMLEILGKESSISRLKRIP